MKATVEVSLYPLHEDYIPPIDDFIQRLKACRGLTVKVNALSTQFSGDYEEVMEALKKEVLGTFQRDGKFVFAMKVLKGDLLN